MTEKPLVAERVKGGSQFDYRVTSSGGRGSTEDEYVVDLTPDLSSFGCTCQHDYYNLRPLRTKADAFAPNDVTLICKHARAAMAQFYCDAFLQKQA